MPILSLDAIEQLATDALVRCGADPVQAEPAANSIREAEAEGIRNVGLSYLPTYLLHLTCGKIVGSAVPVVHPADGSIIKADAGFGFSDDRGGPPGVGQCFIAIDPTRSAPGFVDRLEVLFADLLSETGVRLPGDRRIAFRAQAERDGVEVPADLIATISDYGR